MINEGIFLGDDISKSLTTRDKKAIVLKNLKQYKPEMVNTFIPLLQQIPVVNRLISLGLIGSTARNWFGLLKLGIFLDEFNEGIIDESQRNRYTEIIVKNNAETNKLITHILVCIDRNLWEEEVRLLAKITLAFLNQNTETSDFTVISIT